MVTVRTGRGISSPGRRAAQDGRLPHRLLSHKLVSCICNTTETTAMIPPFMPSWFMLPPSSVQQIEPE